MLQYENVTLDLDGIHDNYKLSDGSLADKVEALKKHGDPDEVAQRVKRNMETALAAVKQDVELLAGRLRGLDVPQAVVDMAEALHADFQADAPVDLSRTAALAKTVGNIPVPAMTIYSAIRMYDIDLRACVRGWQLMDALGGEG